jgi:primary-amine oxidase
MDHLRFSSVLCLFVCYLLLFSSICSADDEFRRRRERGGHFRSHRPQFSNDRVKSLRKRAANGSECIESKPAVIKAPKKNVFRQFSGDETQSVTRWLYQQKELALTHGYFSTRKNTLSQLELMIPNKTDVLAYIDGGGSEPGRYARAILNINSADEHTYNDILVGKTFSD